MTFTQAQIAADIATAYSFADGTVAVTYGSTTVNAYFDRYDEGNPLADADLSDLGRWYKVMIQTGALGALTPETAITVNGQSLRLITWDKDKVDAALTVLYCQTP